MIDDGKFPVLGVRVNAIDYEGAVRRIIDQRHLQRRRVLTGSMERTSGAAVLSYLPYFEWMHARPRL